MSGDEHQHWCRVCRGPVLFWAGSEHQWTCRSCLRAYLDEQVARYDASHAKATEGVRSTKGAEYAMAT